jgi:hypothetical protein
MAQLIRKRAGGQHIIVLSAASPAPAATISQAMPRLTAIWS